MSIGLYIHVPFCASKCAYCDFYSRVRRDQLPDYLDAVKREILEWRGKGISADTLFFGGGTPSLLSPQQIGELIGLCRKVFRLEGEITMEANPDTVTAGSLKGYRAAGVNRLSFGVQSAVDSELKLLGRKHTFADAERAVYAAREAGFDNLTLDLMLGIPEQTAASLQTTLEKISALKPEHLSCYLLKIEEGTPFHKRHMEKLCVDDDETADFYLKVSDYFRNLGYRHYEISNFALPGYESRHNLKYWRCEDYLGFGPAAHSCFGGRRFYHPADLAAYVADSTPVDDGPSGSAVEKLMLALRLSEGAAPLPDYDWDAFLNRCRPYLKAGLMAEENGRIFFTEEGFLLSNTLLAEIL